MAKKWKTKISNSSQDGTVIRGKKLEELIDNATFGEAIFLLLTGKEPSEGEVRMMNAIFVSSIDHGIAPPSVTAARTVFSGGSPMNAAVAAGVLAIGDHHGGALEGAAKFFQENKSKGKELRNILEEYKADGRRIPGYGHKIYETDPRAIKLLDIAEETGISGAHVKMALEVEELLEELNGRKLCLNIDGAIGAIISDMGLDWRLGKGIFIIARTPGLVAHIHEEWQEEKPFRRLDEDEYEYLG